MEHRANIPGHTYHLQGPHAPNPHLQFSLDTIHLLQLDALPPASARGLAPKQQQFLSHADSVGSCEVIAADVGSQPGESNAGDDGLVGFAGAVAPAVVVVEAPGFPC